MSITLERSDGTELRVNAWNWGVLHHLVAKADLFPAELWEPKRFNGGGTLEAPEAATLADFLAERVLPRLREGERMFYDGTITDVADDGTFYREPGELWRNYSLHRTVLVEVIEFLRKAAGPVSFH